MADPVAVGTAIGAALVAVQSKVAQRSGKKALEHELRSCRRAHEECGDKLSAIETELVVLRKLLPGGEWYRVLGLHQYPPDAPEL